MTQESREVAELKQRVAKLEALVHTLYIRVMVADPTRLFASPNGYIEIALGGDTVRLPYFSAR